MRQLRNSGGAKSTAVTKKYKSDVLRSAHEIMSDMHKVGAVDAVTMRDFDRRCLTNADALTPKEIKALRVGTGTSQAVFAEHLGVTKGLVAKWESGEKKPGRMALKLLNVVKHKGLDVIA